ncbi:MAG TPA: xanthine dehydrogenase family protein molybdopterin-binding subunit [Longimicrobiales bacterium]|nr:xanthine dehydrogenase family protein molybdopterin-binding subunit [Longimicrobiales bacterium]
MASVGTNVLRKDGLDKVAGRAHYVDDLTFPDMLYGRTVRSTIARGRLRDVRVASVPGLTIVDHRDIPGPNIVELIELDQPCLVEREVRHAAEPILLLAHADREVLHAVAVQIDYDEMPALLTLAEAVDLQDDLTIEKGDLARGFAEADLIIEGEYRTGHQEQLYIETNGVIAVPDDGGIVIYGSLQCPHYVQRALMRLLDLPAGKVRVIQTETGGGFGGKEEYPNMIAGHAALLALKTQRPVKIIYDRVEDMIATTKRHPFIIRHKTGVKRDGTLTAQQVDIRVDGGAYITLTPVVLSRGAIHATGPYRCDHVRVHGQAFATNTPPNGAFRGFGAPQTLFAAEAHMDRIAEELGLDPVTVRMRNALRPGDSTATGAVMKQDCSVVEVLEEAVRRSDFMNKWNAYRTQQNGKRRGIGLALYYHGSGFTGGGEVKLASRAALELDERGVHVLVGSTEIGQGTRTIHAQIVAETLGIPVEEVYTALPDTSAVPDSGPTVASRTCMVVGGILHKCALELKEKLGELSWQQYYQLNGPLLITQQYEPPPGLVWDEVNYRGDAYGAFAYACTVAEVEIDMTTYEVRPTHMTVVHEIGKAIHPVLLAGQIEGGTAQGIGYALLENVVMHDGAMANASMTNYVVPTTLDTPPMDVHIMERPYAYGPFGAKGVGELPIDGPAPALVNAVRYAGFDVRALPVLPELLAERV